MAVEKTLKPKKVKKEFSCETSNLKIDAGLKKQECGEMNNKEYWKLHEIENNEQYE